MRISKKRISKSELKKAVGERNDVEGISEIDNLPC